MNKLSALALGAALALSLPYAASAQDAGAAPGAGAAQGAGAQAGDHARVSSSDYSFADLDAALQGAANVDLASVTADTKINVVPISSLSDEGKFTMDAFTSSRSSHASEISGLQSKISGNADITSALQAKGYSPDEVVAVWSQADGSLTVFVEHNSGGAGAGAANGANGNADAKTPAAQ